MLGLLIVFYTGSAVTTTEMPLGRCQYYASQIQLRHKDTYGYKFDAVCVPSNEKEAKEIKATQPYSKASNKTYP